ncbi:MAG: alpha-galactosidase, partial [Armatimonadetes bacterium]|nr:alpha-galactosidase [Armatimonadota bacterium]
GGRRNDIETLRRAVPLLRSDYILEPVSQQLHTYGMAPWIPFHGTGINASDPYVFRSQASPGLIGCWDVRRTDLDYAALRKLIAEWRECAPLMLADFYALTPYRQEQDQWMAWQYDRPEDGRGMVQAFRRADSVYEAARLRLQGLDPAGRYRVKATDAGRARVMTGAALMDDGLVVQISERPGAVVLLYERMRDRK